MPMASPDECVLITMGMPACGKTTLVKGGMGHRFHTIVDSPLSSFDTARELRRMARESGRKVAFVYAHRPLADAVRGMLGFTGTWRGHRVTIHGTGMGMPSLSIYVNELIRDSCRIEFILSEPEEGDMIQGSTGLALFTVK